jgi:hypothetical protein
MLRIEHLSDTALTLRGADVVELRISDILGGEVVR